MQLPTILIFTTLLSSVLAAPSPAGKLSLFALSSQLSYFTHQKIRTPQLTRCSNPRHWIPRPLQTTKMHRVLWGWDVSLPSRSFPSFLLLGAELRYWHDMALSRKYDCCVDYIRDPCWGHYLGDLEKWAAKSYEYVHRGKKELDWSLRTWEMGKWCLDWRYKNDKV